MDTGPTFFLFKVDFNRYQCWKLPYISSKKEPWSRCWKHLKAWNLVAWVCLWITIEDLESTIERKVSALGEVEPHFCLCLSWAETMVMIRVAWWKLNNWFQAISHKQINGSSYKLMYGNDWSWDVLWIFHSNATIFDPYTAVHFQSLESRATTYRNM